MILQWIMHPHLQAPQPGEYLKILYNNQSLVVFPYETQGESSLCFTPQRLDSVGIQSISLDGTPWDLYCESLPVFISAEHFYERLFWCLNKITKNFIVLELPAQATFKIIPSKFLNPPELFLPHEIATLSLLERKSIPGRIVSTKPGSIESKNELLERWKNFKYLSI
jgi:hypothetical protein